MVHKILIVTATEEEASGLRTLTQSVSGSTVFGGTQVDFLVTGIGTMATSRGLLNYFHTSGRPDLAINAGIAGSFTSALETGASAVVWRDGFADFGIDDRGQFKTAAEAGLVNQHPNLFSNGGWIECTNTHLQKLKGKVPFCTGITSDIVSGSTDRIAFLKSRYNADIETMESASFFYICALEQVPYIGVRTVSNKVVERDRSSWNIPLALSNLRETIRGIITLLT